MADAKVRVNTLKFAFSRDSTEPTDAEMFKFCQEQQFNPEEIYSIHKEKDARAIFVKFKAENFMKAVLKNMQPVLTFNYANGKAVNIMAAEADNSFKYIRIFNLPPEVEDKEIYQTMSLYGTIRQQIREKYHPSTGFPVFSTVRGLYMEVAKEIPPQIRIRHFQARIFYEGMINKCFFCKSTEHLKANCPRRTVAQYQSSVQGRLYSNVVEAPDLRPAFVKRIETNQMESQMTILNKKPKDVQQQPSGSGIRTTSITRNQITTQTDSLEVTNEESSVSTISMMHCEKDKQYSGSQSDKVEPQIDPKPKKRGRKKSRGDKDVSSNESETEAIKVPGSESTLDAQQRRTRSRSKKPRSASQQTRSRSNSTNPLASGTENAI